jgi:hypothetical protein
MYVAVNGNSLFFIYPTDVEVASADIMILDLETVDIESACDVRGRED